MSEDALAVALDLLRAPSMRSVLRQRPLPGDVGELIELAAGEPGRVARAASSRGETPERVLEAARFYVREVLLFADADAYRVLGVAPGASPEQIKLHHRHLQHWLHPDRRGNDWESAFATRINAAWADLRSPERRAAYAERQPLYAESAVSSHSPRRKLVSQWRAAPFQERRGLGWLAVGVGLACCLWLAILADRQARAPAPVWNPAAGEVEPSAPASLASSFEVASDAGLGLKAAPPRSDREARPVINAVQVAEPLSSATAAAIKVPMSAPKQPRPALVQAKPAAVRPAYTEWTDDIDRKVIAPSPSASSEASASTTIPARAGPTLAPAPAFAPVASAAPTTVSAESVSLLRRRGNQLTRYLAGASGPVPPIWRSVTVQDRALTLRTRLGSGRVRFAEPAWRITAEHASMTTRLQRAGTPVELRADFAWRDGMWLVENLHAEDLQ